MKTIYWLAIPIFFCGCNKPDPGVAQMEAQITVLQSNITELYERNEHRRQNGLDLLSLQTNLLGGLQANLDQMKLIETEVKLVQFESLNHADQIAATQTTLSNLIVSLNAGSVRRPQLLSATPGVMPASVLAQIRADAEAKYPGNYEVQAGEIDNQTRAWYKVNAH